MKKLVLFISIVFLSLTIACSKKDESAPSKAELLTSGSWKLTSVLSDEDGNGTYETDRYVEFEPCFTDNSWTFQSNGVLLINEGSTKCSPNDAQEFESDWQLTDKDATLKIHQDSWILQELSTTTLKWKEEYSDNRGAIVTLSKQ